MGEGILWLPQVPQARKGDRLATGRRAASRRAGARARGSCGEKATRARAIRRRMRQQQFRPTVLQMRAQAPQARKDDRLSHGTHMTRSRCAHVRARSAAQNRRRTSRRSASVVGEMFFRSAQGPQARKHLRLLTRGPTPQIRRGERRASAPSSASSTHASSRALSADRSAARAAAASSDIAMTKVGESRGILAGVLIAEAMSA